MVVVAIVAILAVMAAPSYRDLIDRYRLRAATDDVVNVMSSARANAVKLDRDVNVSFGSTAAGWCVGANAALAPTAGNPAGAAGACDCTASSPACTVGGETLLVPPGKHANVGISGTTTALVFDGNLGLLRPVAEQIMNLSSPSGTYTARVTVRPLGQATVCVPSGSPSMAGVPSC
ncbi:Tfp pilus assembly protein FimT [Lysobacter niabensis]|uniref:Type II secretion system protein H n=2 Tax=Agrilutibacter niabensis TaxID=380628 RepID=A0ABU1VKU5_9GAMM|nr:Tfp pilus assembly protein FimT [Lysobacter niabensis]